MTEVVFGVRLQADGKQFDGQLRASEDALRKLRGETDRGTRSAGALTGTMGNLGRSVLTLAGIGGFGLLSRQAIATADSFTRVESRLKLVTSSVAEAEQVQKRLFAVAQASRQGFVGLAEVYAQVARSSAETGISQTRLLGITQTLSQAVALSGSTATSTRAALIQLSQGLASGTLRGEELNSVMEQTPRLAQAIAQGLGISIGELRKFAQAGELTAEAVLGALERAAGNVQSEFEQLTPTVGDAFTQLSNSGGRFVDVLNDALGVTNTLAGALQGLSGAIDAAADGFDRRVKASREAIANQNRQRLEMQLATMDPRDFRYGKIQSQLQEQNRADVFSGGFDALPFDTGEYAAAQAARNKRLAAFTSDSAVQSASGKKLAEQTALLKSFAEAVKGFESDSAGYQSAYAALMQGLANIDAKGKSTKSAPKAKADELKTLQNELAGLSSGFQKDLATLGRLGVGTDEYRAAVERLIEIQPFARELARETAEADRDAARAIEDASRATESYLGPIEARAEAAEQEIDNYGKTASEIERTTLARLEEARAIAAANGALPSHLAFLDREIAARQRLAEALGSKEAADASRKAAEASAKEWEKVYDDVGQALTDAIFQGGADGWQLLKKTIEATVIRAVVQPVVSQAVGGLLGSFGLGPGGGSSGGSSLLQGAGLLGGLGAFGTGLGAAGASVGAVGLGGTLSAAGSLIGTGSAAGVGAGLGMGAGAIAPYALAAYVALDAMGVFRGATPHRGGAAFSQVGGPSGLATSANTADFGLDWGAFRSTRGGDRSAAVDASVSTLVDGVAASIATRAARYGGDASGIRVTGRFAADNDDPSIGAYRVTGPGGAQFDTFSKFAKDGAQGFQQYGAEAVRAEVAALQSIPLNDWINSLIDVVDPAADSIETLNQALAAADAIAQDVAALEQIRATGQMDAMEAVRVAGLSAGAAYFESSNRIREAAASGSASVQQLAQLSAQHYQNEVALLTSIEAASRSAGDQFADSIRNVRYSVLDDAGKYATLDAEAVQYMDTLRSLTDPAEIERYAGLLDRTINTAFGLLSPEEQVSQAEAFVDRFQQADELVQERLAAVRETVLADQQSLASDLSTAVSNGITAAVNVAIEGLQRAAAAIPEKVEHTLVVRGGGQVRSDIGYIGMDG